MIGGEKQKPREQTPEDPGFQKAQGWPVCLPTPRLPQQHATYHKVGTQCIFSE